MLVRLILRREGEGLSSRFKLIKLINIIKSIKAIKLIKLFLYL